MVPKNILIFYQLSSSSSIRAVGNSRMMHVQGDTKDRQADRQNIKILFDIFIDDKAIL